MLKEIIDEIRNYWNFWSSIIFLISLLGFLSVLEPPTPDNTMDFIIQILIFFLADAIMSVLLGALVNFVTKPIIEFLEEIGIW